MNFKYLVRDVLLEEKDKKLYYVLHGSKQTVVKEICTCCIIMVDCKAVPLFLERKK